MFIHTKTLRPLCCSYRMNVRMKMCSTPERYRYQSRSFEKLCISASPIAKKHISSHHLNSSSTSSAQKSVHYGGHFSFKWQFYENVCLKPVIFSVHRYSYSCNEMLTVITQWLYISSDFNSFYSWGSKQTFNLLWFLIDVLKI